MEQPQRGRLSTFSPSPALQEQARKLLDEYPDMMNRLAALSGTLSEESDALKEAAYRANRLDDDSAHGMELGSAAHDILRIPEMVREMADGSALGRNAGLSTDGNNFLPLFDRVHPHVPTRAEKCLSVISEWMDEVDAKATSKARWRSASPEAITDLDETAGLLYRLREVVIAVNKEISACLKGATLSGSKGRQAG